MFRSNNLLGAAAALSTNNLSHTHTHSVLFTLSLSDDDDNSTSVRDEVVDEGVSRSEADVKVSA